MSPSDYLSAILAREAVDNGPTSPFRRLESAVRAICQEWAGHYLIGLTPTGAFEKGTANRSSVSMDFLASLDPLTPYTMAELFLSFDDDLAKQGVARLRREVSIAIDIGGVAIDIIPGKRESYSTEVHEILTTRRELPVKTSLSDHVAGALAAARQDEIRILKLWRDQNDLDFPSYYLELSVTDALRRRPPGGDLAENVWSVLGYLEGPFAAKIEYDPSNAGNVVSDDLTATGRIAIRDAAARARAGLPWSEIVV